MKMGAMGSVLALAASQGLDHADDLRELRTRMFQHGRAEYAKSVGRKPKKDPAVAKRRAANKAARKARRA